MPQTRVSPGRSKKRLYTCPHLKPLHPAIAEQAAILDAIARIRQAAEEQKKAGCLIPPSAEQQEKKDPAAAPVNALYE